MDATTQSTAPNRLQALADSHGAFATLAAQFASRGFALHPLDDESMVVSRWGMHRVLPDIDAARTFLVRVGGPA